MAALSPIIADNITHRHGFFTRLGGQSTGIYAELNCALGSYDTRAAIIENRAKVTQWFDLPTTALRGVYQTHSAKVENATLMDPTNPPKADALISDDPNFALGILTADCAPILFSDSKAGIIGAAHAGWRGALGGVITNTVEEMCKLGAQRDQISAAVGPCISQRNYEVGAEFMDDFISEDSNFSQFFANGAAGKYQFDLPRFCLHQLRSAGLSNVLYCGHCTYDDVRFYSYRRMCHLGQVDCGRQISVIAI